MITYSQNVNEYGTWQIVWTIFLPWKWLISRSLMLNFIVDDGRELTFWFHSLVCISLDDIKQTMHLWPPPIFQILLPTLSGPTNGQWETCHVVISESKLLQIVFSSFLSIMCQISFSGTRSDSSIDVNVRKKNTPIKFQFTFYNPSTFQIQLWQQWHLAFN